MLEVRHVHTRYGPSHVLQGVSLTVRENLKVAACRGPWTMDDIADRFPALRERWTLMAGRLSGGQQQMLAMGRALVGNRRLILMDEPTEGLDPQTVARIGDTIDELRRRGTSAILVEQKVDFALRRVDRAIVLGRGRVVHEAADPGALRADTATLHRLLAVGG